MPEYSSTTITPADGVQTPAMNGSTSGNYTLAELRNFILASKGLANGLASLDANGKLPLSQLPDLADDVIVVASYAVLPATGTAGKLYITADNNKGYRWDPDLATPAYVLLFNPADIDTILKIISGAQVVGKAAADGNGNNIVETYATKTALNAEAAQREAYDNALNARITNLEQTTKQDEQTVSYPDDGNYSSIMPNGVPARVAKFAEVPRFRGKSRAWNQLMNPAYASSDTVNGITFTNNGDGSWTVSGTASADSYIVLTGNVEASHKYLLGIIGATNVYVWQFGYDGYKTNSFNIQNNSSSSVFGFFVPNGAVISTPEIVTPILRDITTILTDWNPSDITTANIPLMVKQIPDLLKWDANDAGSLVDTVVSGVKSVGKNLAQINNFTQSVSYGTEVPLVLKGGLTYTASGTVGGGSTLRLLKSDGTYQYIGLNENFDETFVAEGDITDATFFGVVTVSNFQVELGSSKTSFAPWVNPDTLMLSAPVTLKSAGAVSEVLDVQTGKKTRPIGSVDLGSLNWTKQNSIFYSEPYADIVAVSSGSVVNGVTADYIPVYLMGVDATPYCIAVSNTPRIYVNDPSFASVDADAFKTAMNGKIFYYEKATPDPDEQVCDPIIDNFIEVEGGGTINTIQEQTPVIDNCLDVTYDFIPA